MINTILNVMAGVLIGFGIATIYWFSRIEKYQDKFILALEKLIKGDKK